MMLDNTIKSVEILDFVLKNCYEECVDGLYSGNQPPMPNIVYHYTSIAALTSIICNNELHLSNIHFCNDPQEIINGIGILDNAWSNCKNKYRDHKNFKNFDEMVGVVKWVLEKGRETGYEVFVLCFSAKDDDLRQWMPYGEDGRGASIGFETKELDGGVKGFNLIRVSYHSDEQKHKYLACLFEKVFEIYDRLSDDENLLDYYQNSLYHILLEDVISCKSSNYADEYEYRLVYIAHPKFSDYKFKCKDDFIIPYIDYTFDRLSLINIILGPQSSFSANKHALSLIKKSKGFLFTINKSDIYYGRQRL